MNNLENNKPEKYKHVVDIYMKTLHCVTNCLKHVSLGFGVMSYCYLFVVCIFREENGYTKSEHERPVITPVTKGGKSEI